MSSNGFIDSGVKCGNCKQYHANAAEVKLCFLEAKEAQASVPATAKQESFLRKLAGERDHGWADAEAVIKGTLTSKAATSELINTLLGMPKAAPKATAVVQTELADGVYRHDDKFYKVYHTVHGANVQVAKVLHVTATGTDEDGKQLWKGTWEYVGKKPLYTLKPEHKLTKEEAKQFGLVYGMCVRCTRDLTREESIHVGYGPTCAGIEGWWYPTKAELKALAEEPAWKAQVANAEQDAFADYANEPF
jgi:hypothetical protein